MLGGQLHFGTVTAIWASEHSTRYTSCKLFVTVHRIVSYMLRMRQSIRQKIIVDINDEDDIVARH